MPKNMPICLALFGATEDDGSNRRNIHNIVEYSTMSQKEEK